MNTKWPAHYSAATTTPAAADAGDLLASRLEVRELRRAPKEQIFPDNRVLRMCQIIAQAFHAHSFRI